MKKNIDTDICVIGAGSGGLSVAAGARQMGAETVLIEKGKMGGDCLNYGCVPSKALLVAAHAAQSARRAGRFGIGLDAPTIESAKVFAHVREAIAAIAPHDSVERFEGLGVKVLKGAARFTGRGEVEVNGTRIKARRFVVATGSSPFIPPIPGLEDVAYLTNETLFEQTDLPDHLIVVGGGPIGVEMAQAHRRLGCAVTLIEGLDLMPRDDPELVAVVRQRLQEDGIVVHEGVLVEAVEKTPRGVRVTSRKGGESLNIQGSRLLIATGRKPNLEGLALDAAGIKHSRQGIEVDRRLRTSNRKIFAIGDVTGGYQFTHMAAYHAGVVIKNALFRLPARTDDRAVPWVTYSDPELAYVGLSERDAIKRYGDALRILRWPFSDNDRAVAEGDTEGLAKILATKKGKILGAGLVGPRAGELIGVWCLALSRGLKVGAVATMIAPYPTLGEINKRVAGSFFTPSLFSEKTRRIVKFLARFG